MATIYTTVVNVIGGRDGEARSSDGALEVALASPPELGGDGRAGTNPEQLFAAGYGACFQTALRVVASRQRLELGETSVRSTVRLNRDAEGAFELGIVLDVSLPSVTTAQAEQLVRTVHEEVCPYSHAVRGNVDVEVRVAHSADDR